MWPRWLVDRTNGFHVLAATVREGGQAHIKYNDPRAILCGDEVLTPPADITIRRLYHDMLYFNCCTHHLPGYMCILEEQTNYLALSPKSHL